MCDRTHARTEKELHAFAILLDGEILFSGDGIYEGAAAVPSAAAVAAVQQLLLQSQGEDRQDGGPKAIEVGRKKKTRLLSGRTPQTKIRNAGQSVKQLKKNGAPIYSRSVCE